MNSKQFLYGLRGKIIEGGVIALTVGGAGYFFRQQYEPGNTKMLPDEIE